jgi:hypothetical protein
MIAKYCHNACSMKLFVYANYLISNHFTLFQKCDFNFCMILADLHQTYAQIKHRSSKSKPKDR